ncbi:hypothetical protein [Microbacterium sp. SORGH_AS_0862]|uniref:hypothetical protein n=1 Tax=Microbacterium sp. SORGH_AS_0862 TaxID=3041789 RepID=UPI0027D8FE08|nr:hypothetical protein [Microbacterium sp. SORGH_AS_0862]
MIELRGDDHGVRLLIKARVDALSRVAATFDGTLSKAHPREPVNRARAIQPRPSDRAFASDSLEISTRELYRAVSAAKAGEVAAVQVVLGARLGSSTSVAQATSASILAAVLGTKAERLDNLVNTQRLQKARSDGFTASIRLGATADSSDRERALLRRLHSAVRRLEAPGVRLTVRGTSTRSFDRGSFPLWWQHLTIREATALSGLPIGDELPGLPTLHPVLLPPPYRTTTEEGRLVLADATAPGVNGTITLGEDAILRGLHILGPVGVGKSDLAANLLVQWIDQGKAALVLEPKVDLSRAVVRRVAPKHRDRIVCFDLLSEDGVIGLNPLRLNGQPLEVVVDSLVNIFSSVLSDVIGVTTRDLLHAALSSLAQYPGATLLMLPLLLADPKFRRKVVSNVAHDVFLQAYWAEFEGKSEQARAHLVSPVLVRLRGLLLRPSFRRSLGQAEPKFDVREVFGEDRRVLLAPLPEAQLGKQGAALLGSLLLHEAFVAIRERALIPAERRHPVMVALDEWHRFTHGAQDFAEALTLFRGYGAGFVLCNQVLSQISRELRDVVTGTVRSRVYFQLGAEDAAMLARHSPEIETTDLMQLEQFNVYAALYEDGRTQGFASGRTIKLPEPLIEASQIRAESQRRFGVPPAEVEREVTALYSGTDPAVDQGRPPPHIGRRIPPTTNAQQGDPSQ